MRSNALRERNAYGTRIPLFWSLLVGLWLGCAGSGLLLAEVVTGNNNPGAYTDLPIAVLSSTTNLSLTVAGDGTAWSYILVKKNGVPSDTDYDWSSQLDRTTNAIYLEGPEIVPGDQLVVRVKTPASSGTHSFTLYAEPNRTDLRTVSKPVTKSLTSFANGLVKNGTNEYYRVEFLTTTPTSVALDGVGGPAPDLYWSKGTLPTTTSYTRKSTGSTNNLIALTTSDTSPGVYYIGVFGTSALPNGEPYKLTLTPITTVNLSWDPGDTHVGSTAFTNTTDVARDYYYHIITANPAVGAWRTALRVLSGEANLYLGRGILPTPALNSAASENVGSDGVLLALGNTTSGYFQPGEEWYILVRAKAGSTWSLVSGTPYVQALGTVAADDSTGSGPVEIGPEGMRFFRADITTDTLAWRLWLNGQTNSIWLKKATVPLTGPNLWEYTQPGQMLVVPPYLSAGSYYVGVSGKPGSTITLDNRQQPVIDLPYGNNATCSATGFAYVTYRVQVPADQIAWQLYLPNAVGNPSIAVRRNTVPSDYNNDALSDLPGTNAENVALVPPALGNGTFYVTLFNTNVGANISISGTLQSGPATITDIQYHSSTLNTDTNRVGWRFFRLPNGPDQMSGLGWDLWVSNAVPGTTVALRRGNVPSIWYSRSLGIGTVTYSTLPVNNFDTLSSGPFLQDPAHEPDTWYIGVYNPTNALGAFTLISGDLVPTALADNVPIVRTNSPAGRWDFYKVTLAASDITGPNAILGWDVRLCNVTSGVPKLVVCKDKLPVNMNTTLVPTYGIDWPSGTQWAPLQDWTQRSYSPIGTNEDGRILAAAVGRPVVPGTYFIGVMSSVGTNSANYTILSRWIGVGRSLPVVDLDYATGRVTNTVAVREAAYYRVNVPAGSDSWKWHIKGGANGETMAVVTTNFIPNMNMEKRMEKPGDEWYVRVPSSTQASLWGGSYYIAVIGEGDGLTNSSKVGSGSSPFTLESLGQMPRVDLGTLDQDDIYYTNQLLAAGEVTGYKVHVAPGCWGYWALLERPTGNPWLVLNPGALSFPDPGYNYLTADDPYGNEGGAIAGVASSPFGITIAAPGDTQDLVVKSRVLGTGAWQDSSYVLHIKPARVSQLNFDGGTATVTNSAPTFGEFYYVDVPTNAVGWDLRLTNVTAGTPRLYIGKDTIPLNANTWPSGDPYAMYSWTYDAWLPGALDCTGKPYDADGTDETGRLWMDGINRPLLVPGRYYVQVVSYGGPANYTLLSRGIGNVFSLATPSLTFSGGQATVSNLPPREAAYFKVTVPTNATSWKVQVNGLSGDSTLCVLKGTPPNIGAITTTSSLTQDGRRMQRAGDEYYLLLPAPGSDYLNPADYYVSVTSEGMGSTATNRLGTNASTFTVTSVGQAPITNMGVIGPNSIDVTSTNILAPGDTAVYQFTIATNTLMATVYLSPVSGTPTLALLNGTRIPDPSAYIYPYATDPYGNEGGELTGETMSTNSFSLPNPTPGLYTLIIKARGTNAANYLLHTTVTAVPLNDLAFDPGLGAGNVFPVSGQAGQTWDYWAVNVPTNAQGWDVRITGVSGGSPKLVVKRASIPTSTYTQPWTTPGIYANWPTNNQWASAGDWTKRTYAADGLTSEDGRIVAMGMYRPLEPGLYYVGVFNSATAVATNATSYTLISRGIGPGMALPIVDLPAGASITNFSLAPREAAYYRVVTDSNTPSLKLSLNILTNLGGECMLTGLRGALPNVNTISGSTLQQGKTMQKPGDEHLVLLPVPGATNIVAGTNYFAVVGEGMNPSSSLAVGRGTSAYTLTNEGPVQVTDLGVVSSDDIVQPDVVPGGDIKAYRFEVFPGTYGVQIRLDNRSGNPTMGVVQGDQLPDPGAGSTILTPDTYGNEGGYAPIDSQPSILTIANPAYGDYTVVVKARATGTGYPDAGYTLHIVEVLAPELNFSQELNTNGLPNSFSGLIQDNERAFFRIEVPATNNGQPVIGWQLNLSQTAGLALMRARKDALPSDSAANQMGWATASAILAPPYLTNGIWFVEVKGSNTTAFTLTSRALTLVRPVWNMPLPGQTTNTAGLTLPFFADTGIDTNGVPLADPMLSLQQGEWHYYGVQVPDGNIGLMRAELQAGSGNPDLYLRQGAVPTLYHLTTGGPGTIVDRSMANLLDTEYANWVPFDGKVETQLKPGLWYMAVKASGGSSARYRLRLSAGSVADLPLDGTVLTNQTVLGGDWCYYRFTPPTGIPMNVALNFGRDYGDVLVQLRSVIPPGNGASGQVIDIKDWASDRKNPGPYTNYTQPGSFTLTAPPVRPGEVLYLGLRATSRSTFSIGVSNAAPNSLPPQVLAFAGGTAQTTVPKRGSVLYRVDVPPNATRWKHSASHDTNIVIYVDQGTLPATNTPVYKSTLPNSSLNQPLVTWNTALRAYSPATWPWVAGFSYYIQVVNNGTEDEAFSIIMDGRDVDTDDNDSNGLPDQWELYYFGKTGNSGSADADGDGVSNLTEYLEKTDPTNPKDYRPRLYVAGINGTVAKSPDLPSYPMGGTVTLTPSPNAGYAFVGWSGDVTSTDNPLALVMNSHKTLLANFKRAGDDFITALPLSGPNATATASNMGYTKEPGEPYHAGNYGGKSIWWNWTAPKDGPVSLSTAGSTFPTLLAVYTGNAVNALTPVASDYSSPGSTNSSHVSFSAKGGTLYRIAVDGYNGASASIQLTLAMSGTTVVPLLAQPHRDTSGTLSLKVHGAPSHSYTVEYSSDLKQWTAFSTTLTTDSNGDASFSDSTAGAAPARFYRVKDSAN